VHDYVSLLQGKAMETKKLAKRAVALETCIRLHKMGELNEHLLPRDHEETLVTCPELFPVFREEEAEDGPRRGSSKRKQAYGKEVSSLSQSVRASSPVVPRYH
jgi:endoribonuclease Dicer